MDNIISELDYLYQYIVDEFTKSNINKNNINSITDFCKNLDEKKNETKKKLFITTISRAINTFKSKKKLIDNDFSRSNALCITGIVILTIVFSIAIFTKIILFFRGTPGARDTYFTSLLGFITIIVGIIVVIDLMLVQQTKNTNAKKNAINKLFNLCNDNLTVLYNSIAKYDENKFITALKSFIDLYEDKISVLKMGDYARYKALDNISYFFVEQGNIIYKNDRSISNKNDATKYITNILTNPDIIKKLINDLNLTLPDDRKINDLGSAVDKFINKLFNTNFNYKITNFDDDKIFIIIKSNIKLKLKFADVNIEVLKYNVNTELAKKTLHNLDLAKDNYSYLIDKIYDSIANDQDTADFFKKEKTVSNKFIDLNSFITFYDKLTIRQLTTIYSNIEDTKSSIASLLAQHKPELVKQFDDKKRKNLIFLIIILTSALSSVCYFSSYIKDVNAAARGARLDRRQYEEFRINRLIKIVNFGSIWAFLIALLMSTWYKQGNTIQSNVSLYDDNTDIISNKLQLLLDDLSNLTTLKDYIQQNANNTPNPDYKIEDIEKLLTSLEYTYVINNNQIVDIKKRYNQEELFTLYDLNDVKNELYMAVYYDLIVVMTKYECCNYLESSRNTVSFPTNEIFLNVILLCICAAVLFYIFQTINPVTLMTDLKNYKDCYKNFDTKYAGAAYDRNRVRTLTGQWNTLKRARDAMPETDVHRRIENKAEMDAVQNLIQNELRQQLYVNRRQTCIDLSQPDTSMTLSRTKVVGSLAVVMTSSYLIYNMFT